MRIQQTSDQIPKPILHCKDFIDTQLEEKLNLQVLAVELRYSTYYLSRRFQEEMGIGVAAYIRSARIGQSKMLLQTTDLSISEIASRF